jgi:hypothetical protein
MKKGLTLFFTLISLLACNKLKSTLQGDWLIEKVYYNNKPVIYDLYSNGFNLNKDHTCWLPMSAVNENQPDVEKGSWETYTKDTVSYLKIQTVNKVFNRTFRVLNFRKELDYKKYGYLLKMTLIADSLRIECAKVPY